MKNVQVDIFGNEIPVEEVPRLKVGRKKYTTMQERYGTLQGKTCKTCKHLVERKYGKTYYKCDLWVVSSSEATDIRLKNTACKKYELRGGE